MKTFVWLMFLMAIPVCFGQKTPSPTVEAAPSRNRSAVISAADWKTLTDAFAAEDWTRAANLAAEDLRKTPVDNDQKQLAQLRYLRLYALAGRVLAVSGARVPVDADALWKELDDAATAFVGQQLVLPPHSFLRDCEKRVNYICRVADDDLALRVTATNKEGTGIHSFDYFVFEPDAMPKKMPETEFFIGGTLKRIEYNQDSSKPWVMRLIFEKGFVSVAAAIEKQ